MLYISDNLKHLRNKQNLSQQAAADGMQLPLDRYKKYEYGKNTPPAETLLVISRFYHISIDIILTVDLRKIPVDNLIKLENRLLLPIMVDKDGNDLVEIVTEKAKAGYLDGYGDPEYIENLQLISLPFLGPGKHRGFPVDGDSMPPHEKGSIIIGKYVEKLGDVLDGKTYIIVTKNEGIVYKRLNKNKKNVLIVESDNTFYPNYEVKASDIIEIWEYECNIGRNDSKPIESGDDLKNLVIKLSQDMDQLKRKIG